MKKSAQTVFLVIFAIFTLTGMAFAGALPDTGQTKCYNDTAEITCPVPGEDFYGQDAQYVTNPRSYTKLDASGNDLSDSATSWAMVRDNVTGLLWEVKTDGGSVHDKDNTYNWDDAQSVFIAELNSANFGGYSDWRLPTIKELASIANLGTLNPAVNTEYFHDTQSSFYWSDTTVADYTDDAWYMNFDYGIDNYNHKLGSHYYVRGVRSGQAGSFDDLIINGDGTVTDPNTGLMWQQEGPDSQMTWKDALTYCEGLSVAGYNDWRLPSREELRSIVDYGRYNLSIDSVYFPDTRSSAYWSATSGVYGTDCAWFVDFYSGSDAGSIKSLSHYVRAVRVKEENKWEITTVDSEGMAGMCPSIALDPNNNPGISYSTQSSPYLIKFAKKDNDNWTNEIVKSNTNSGHGATELAFDSNSFPRIVSDDYPSNHSYSEWNSSAWQTQTFSILPTQGDIKIGDSDFSHIVWYAGTNLEYRLWNGSGWQPETVDASGDVGYAAQLILDDQGRKYVSYAEWGHKLKFAFHDGSNWSVEYVDNFMSTANTPHPIGLDSQDRPVILYFDNEDGVGVIKLASKVDGQWQFEAIPLTTHVYPGRKLGFAIDASDRIHISCYQKESAETDICYLKHFLYDGSNWSDQIVDQFVTQDTDFIYTSLALSPEGTIHIAYTDPLNYDLKYATNAQSCHSLAKSVSPVSGGTISASPEKFDYADGESVTLTATPDSCYEFSGWSGDCSGTNPTCTFTMDADKSVTANFAVRKYSLNITANNGSVTKSPNQSSYDCGTTVLLTASPNLGYNFDHWEGDATGTQTTASITMTEEMNITAVFVSGSYTISGYVRDGDNTGISGVTLDFSNSGGSATTDSSGFYTRSVSSGWIGTVTPEKSGYSFDPQKRTYSAVTANQSDQNYTAAPQQQDYTLSGYVRDSNNIGISGVTLTFSNSGGSATTNNSGYYTQTVTSGWSGTITPSKQGYTFEPADRSYTAISTDQFNQDYTGIPIPFTISGYVRDSGNKGLTGVRLSFSNYAGSAETDSSGYYSHTVYYGWTGTVTPEKSGYTFTPANLSYTGTSSNHTGQNYTGTPTAVPDIAVSPSSLIFTKPTSRSGRSGAETHTSLPVSQITDRDVSLPTDGEHATGLIIPDHVRKHWKTHTPTRKYRSRQNLPASKDWSVYDSPVKNQGSCGSCWAFATVAMMENLANQANLSVSKDFAEQVLVSCVYTGSGGCSGGWYWDALSYIRQNGLPPENCYPYKTSNGNCGSKCTNPDFLVKIEDFTPQYGLWGSSGFTVQDLKGALQDGPLCVAMYVADDFYSYSGGIYDYTGGNYEWGHAVFLVGYNDSQQYFKVRNSWGTWWGEGGYFRIAYNDVTDNIKFGSYAVAASGIFVDGEGQTEDVIVSNTGTGTLTVSSISSDKAWLEFSPQTLSALAPNEEKTLTLSVGDWNSVASPEETATLTISSDDPDEPSVNITVKAAISVMAARPVLMVSPPFYGNISTASDGNTQIEVPNNSGETYLDVSNGGDGTMTWTTESDNAWLKITQGNAGTDYGRVIITYEENTGGLRTGTITVSAIGATNSPQSVKIRQTDIDVDADDDGMTDSFEFQHGLDPSNPDDASGDRDEDGLTNLEEHEIGTNPNLEDTDDDGMSDGYEANNGLNPLVYNGDDSSPFRIGDAVTAIRILAGMNANLAGTNADADENGTVEMKDAVFILQEIAGLR